MTDQINIIDVLNESERPPLEIIRLGETEAALIFFTPQGESIFVHFCEEPNINSYVTCNNSTGQENCVLCRIGKGRIEKFLIPAYLPVSKIVGVLPVSRSLRPHALLPQIGPFLKSKKPVVLFISRKGNRYKISSNDLSEDTDAGEDAIKRFLKEFKEGRARLKDVYLRISNEQLASESEIAHLLELKGIKINADDKGE